MTLNNKVNHMINYIKGTILTISETNFTIFSDKLDLAFQVFNPNSLSFAKNQEVSLYTYMHWNQEQGPTLYGFLTEEEKKIFLLIIDCSGIGPKIALTILAQMKPGEFIKIIQDQDVKALSSINGLGPKKSEQIIVQLKHKIVNLMESGFAVEDSSSISKHIRNVSDVLNSLNYSKQEIISTLDYLRNNSQIRDFTFDQLLRHALGYLSKRI